MIRRKMVTNAWTEQMQTWDRSIHRSFAHIAKCNVKLVMIASLQRRRRRRHRMNVCCALEFGGKNYLRMRKNETSFGVPLFDWLSNAGIRIVQRNNEHTYTYRISWNGILSWYPHTHSNTHWPTDDDEQQAFCSFLCTEFSLFHLDRRRRRAPNVVRSMYYNYQLGLAGWLTGWGHRTFFHRLG